MLHVTLWLAGVPFRVFSTFCFVFNKGFVRYKKLASRVNCKYCKLFCFLSPFNKLRSGRLTCLFCFHYVFVVFCTVLSSQVKEFYCSRSNVETWCVFKFCLNENFRTLEDVIVGKDVNDDLTAAIQSRLLWWRAIQSFKHYFGTDMEQGNNLWALYIHKSSWPKG